VSRWLAAFRGGPAPIYAETKMPVSPRNPISGGNGAFGLGVEERNSPPAEGTDAWHAARLFAAAERAVGSPDALEDEAETLFMGELP
jgi:hypothetical protein